MNDGDLPLSPNVEMENRLIEDAIRRQARDGRTLQILEAGCGQRWSLNMKGINYVLTGVDLDRDALNIRKNVEKDLHEGIHGDLRTVDLGGRKFDVIYCAFVLEHVADAEQVLRRFVEWLRPNGVIVLTIPDPLSAHGFVTRFSPHWLHVLYYRWVQGYKDAGKPGCPPYPVEYDPIVSRGGIKEFCAAHGLSVEVELGDGYIRPGRGLMKVAVASAKMALHLVSFGRLSHRHTNLLYMLRLPEKRDVPQTGMQMAPSTLRGAVRGA